jgi:hypothetical protein
MQEKVPADAEECKWSWTLSWGGGGKSSCYAFAFQKIFLFSPLDYNNTFIMYIKSATCFGLSCVSLSGNTLHGTELCVPRSIISELANLHKQYIFFP